MASLTITLTDEQKLRLEHAAIRKGIDLSAMIVDTLFDVEAALDYERATSGEALSEALLEEYQARFGTLV